MTAIDFAAFVDRLATASGDTILPFFRTALAVEAKHRDDGAFDPVTAADRAAETAMRTLIRRSFPEHGIVGEEYGADQADAEYVWYLDPIDGTKAFISGMPLWGTLIALTRFGEPVFGMMHQPFTGERFSGDGGVMTTWENGPPQAAGRIVVAGDRRVHAAALELLNR
jgi:myo-inositol-1(or 4)-monophosphatase